MAVFQRVFPVAALRCAALCAFALPACFTELGGLAPAYSDTESGAIAPGPGPATGPDAAVEVLAIDGGLPDANGSDADLARGDAEAGDARVAPGQTNSVAVLSSPAFSDGAPLPETSTCAGQNQSPAFSWTAGPAATQSYALALSALGASGVFNAQWVVWDIDGQARSLPSGVQAGSSPGNVPGARQANVVTIPSDVFFPYYRGPCSYGAAQEFVFSLYALAVDVIPLSAQLGDPQAVVEWIETSGKLLSTSQLHTSFP